MGMGFPELIPRKDEPQRLLLTEKSIGLPAALRQAIF
jgi:hypothetical protein